MDNRQSSDADNQTQMSVESAFARAVANFNAERYAEVDKLCTAILKAVPNHINAINLLGVVAQKVNRHDLAIEQFQRAIKIDSSRTLLGYNLGISLYELGRKEEAVKTLKKALERDPENSQISDYLNRVLSLDLHSELSSATEILQQGVSLHHSGRLDEAINCYQKILEIDPENTAALSNLGLALQTLGKFEEAVINLKKAISIDPGLAEAHFNIGNLLKRQGSLDEAVASYQKAISINPDKAEFHNNLGNILYNQDKLSEAVKSYQKAISIDPGFADAHNNLGNVLKDQGRVEEAVVSYKKAISINPDLAGAHGNIGNVLKDQGRLEEAVASYKKAISINPGLADVHSSLGSALKRQGRLEEAVASYKKAISINPGMAVAHSNLGNALKDQGREDAAVASYRKAISINPDLADAHNNLGNALKGQDRLEEAVLSFRQAISINPGLADAHNNLANISKVHGKLDEAVTSYQKALAIFNLDLAATHTSGKSEKSLATNKVASIVPDSPDKPISSAINASPTAESRFNNEQNQAKSNFGSALRKTEIYSNLLFCNQYIPGQTQENLLSIHKGWERLISHSDDSPVFYHNNDLNPDRQLRVGLVSADFGYHPIGFFMFGFFKYHNAELKIFCYSDREPDEMTKQLESFSDSWALTKYMTDDELAERIYSDKIDILIDLSGHSATNRLLVFAKKPAPIQMSWAGYVGTTGLSAMDWVIADKNYAADGDEKFYTEEILRLPDSWVCYTPPKYLPALISRSALDKANCIVLGNFGNPGKINDTILEVWSRIMRQCANTNLLLVYMWMDSPPNIHRITSFFEKAGINRERIIIDGHKSNRELLNAYNSVDLALDTQPYSGGLTTFEALCMGTPVITTYGATFAGRHSASILRSVGLDELVASSLDNYVEYAVDLISNPDKLQTISRGLRERFLNSPPCDCNKFSLDLTMELRKIWRRWSVGKKRG
ncbi:MAG: tetratricopeptide repeat protein [Magnetococcales bacterium]|nr:tetratricopeptide repeat protein [Magnetococcales bacterium]